MPYKLKTIYLSIFRQPIPSTNYLYSINSFLRSRGFFIHNNFSLSHATFMHNLAFFCDSLRKVGYTPNTTLLIVMPCRSCNTFILLLSIFSANGMITMIFSLTFLDLVWIIWLLSCFAHELVKYPRSRNWITNV